MDEEVVDLLKKRQKRAVKIIKDYVRDVGIEPEDMNDVVQYLLSNDRLDDLVVINHVYYIPIRLDVIERSGPLIKSNDDQGLAKLVSVGAYLDYDLGKMRLLARTVPSRFVTTHETFKQFGYE